MTSEVSGSDTPPADVRPDISVLHLIKGLGPGGAENLLLGMAQRSEAERPFDVAFLLPWKDHLVNDLAECGVVIHALNAPRLGDPRWIVRLRRIVIDGRYDVVHLHSPLPAALSRPMLRSLGPSGRPAVVSVEQNSWSSHHRLTRWLNRASFRLGDAWLAVSEDTRRSLPERLRGRVVVVPNGVDVAAIASHRSERVRMRSELGLSDDDIAVGTVANLRSQKDYPNMLHAASLALAENDGLRFFAVGQGPLENELHHLRDDLGLGERFTFLGYRDDVRAVLSAMDLYTQASAHEGTPLAVMEALAAGLPIVATAVGGTPELVVDHTTGVLVAHGDIRALAAAWCDLARDGERRAEMAAAAEADAQRFDVGAVALAWSAVYESALGGLR